MMRAQTSLPAVGVALVLLVTTATFAVAFADERLGSSRARTLERQAAAAVADSLVSAQSAVTRRGNVLDAGALERLDAGDLTTEHGLHGDSAVRVSVGERVLVARGSASGGRRVERIVLIENRSRRTIEPPFRTTRRVTLPRRTPNVTLQLAPAGNTTIDRVRVGGRVVLSRGAGLNGTYSVDVPRFRTATLGFESSGRLERGDVSVTYYPARTEKTTLSVTVDRWGAADG
jgi:hypothetical protein